MHDLTVPASIAVFFLGLILTLRFALPRWKDVRSLTAELASVKDDVAKLTPLLERLDVVEANIKTLHGNLVTVRDQVQFKSLAVDRASALMGMKPK